MLAPVTLAPGGVYEKTGEIDVAPGAPAGPLRCRLRFVPVGSRVAYESNVLILRIVP